MMKTNRDLIVWQKSIAMVTDFYKMTRDFPHEDLKRMLGSLIRKVEQK